MGRDDGKDRPGSGATKRDDRLKEALKANLQRRKAQARARRVESGESGKDQSPKGTEHRETD